ncbi:MAG: LicD family protein [Hungatella sp.]|nr:LicD family protein [Hungatella sp.]
MKDNRESADCCRELSEEYGLKEVHEANLKMLKEIDRICRKYGIRYGLDAGTLIGAVRHQGFIPWDDDADVAFTRENYEKFARVVRKELPAGMKFLEPSQLRGGEGFYDFTPRILYMNSRTHEDGPEMEYYEGRLNHLWVDLFIMDEQPECRIKAAWIKGLHTLIYGLAMGHRYKLDYSRYGALGKAAVAVLAGVGNKIPMRYIRRMQYSLAVRYHRGKSRFFYYSNYQPDFLYVTVERSWVEETVDLLFEDTVLMAPKGWEQVLNEVYEDYKTLPPKEKRVPSHSSTKIKVTG